MTSPTRSRAHTLCLSACACDRRPVQLLAMHDDLGDTRGSPHRSTIRFGARDPAACARTVEAVAMALAHSNTSAPHHPPPTWCPKAYPPLLARLTASFAAGQQQARGHAGTTPTWLAATAAEVCVVPIAPATALRLARAHVMQLELPGDSLFSAPSTLCAFANGAVRLLDPRIRTSSDHELAAVPASAAPDRPLRVDGVCALAATTRAAEHAVFAELGAQNRLFAQRCLGKERPRLLGAAIRAFAAARTTTGCRAARPSSTVVEALFAKAASDDAMSVHLV